MYEVLTYTTLLGQRFDTKTKYETWEAAARAVEFSLDIGLTFSKEINFLSFCLASQLINLTVAQKEDELECLPPVYLRVDKLQ